MRANNNTTRLAKTVMTLLFGLAITILLATWYAAHLRYHEQFQMLLLTWQYACEVLSLPGGVAEYLSRFAIQFFGNGSIGALILAVMLCLYQWLIWRSGTHRQLWLYPLTFVPMLIMWMFCCDEDSMPTALFAQILSLGVSLAIVHINNRTIRDIATVLAVPILYMACGPLGYVGIVVVLIRQLTSPETTKIRALAVTALAIAVAILCPVIASKTLPYSLHRLSVGLHYNRFGTETATLAYVAAVTACVVVLILTTIGRDFKRVKTGYIVTALLFAGVAVGCYVGVKDSCDMAKEEAYAYQQLAYDGQWDAIISKAAQKQPNSPTSVVCLNLALAKTNQLGEQMFNFFQNGSEGLFSTHIHDFVSPLASCEAFYQLGMVNTAQRYLFETQEAIPDNQKSARLLKRLAETNLINGQYDVANKYLKTLQNTLMYSDWANETMALISDEAAVNSHPEYGVMRRIRPRHDVMFSEYNLDSMVDMIQSADSTNRLAHEYAMAVRLLNKDLDGFYQIFTSGNFVPYDRIPTAFQEALVMIWVEENPSWQGIPWAIDESVKQRAEMMMRDWQSKMPPQIFSTKYRGTYWGYFI